MGKHQDIPVVTSSASLCTTEHTVGPGDVSLCCTVSALISSKALAEGTPGEPCWFAQEVELLIFSE